MNLEDVNVPAPESPEAPEPGQPAGESGNPAPGSQTDPALLLKSLQEEREKRRVLEERIELLENSPDSPDVFSDEGKALQKEIASLKTELSGVNGELSKKEVLIAYPVLKEKWEEFETFRADPDNSGMNLRTAAKAFMVENGLLDAPRKGLEKPSGGSRIPPSTGLSVEEITDLRENNWPKYQQMIRQGSIKV